MADINGVETLEAHDGTELYCQHYPSPESLGVIMTVHDYGQHSGAYRPVHERLAKQGLSVYTLDLRGHGRSPGARASIAHFEDFLDDLDLLYARVKDREPGRALFLMGQGMGALIALHYAVTRRSNLHGLILCGGLPELPVNAKEKLLASYGALLLNHVEAHPLARELLLAPAIDGVLKDDALAFRGAVNAKTILELNEANQTLEKSHAHLGFPVLTIAAESYASPIGRMHEALLTHDKILLPYEGRNHPMLLSSDWDRILGDIIEWCKARVEKIDDNDEWDMDGEDDSL